MEYIKKSTTPPGLWEDWFTRPAHGRTYDYGADSSSLRLLPAVRQFLINEQNGLCAYCQKKITLDNSSIEHVIPKELNKEFSTSYFNLVAACRKQIPDEFGRFHCDMEKGNKIITPILFLSNSIVTEVQNNRYFEAYSDGTIDAKPSLPKEEKKQVNSFIEILNLNHQILKDTRAKDYLDGYIANTLHLTNHEKRKYWKTQYSILLNQRNKPFRQFLLIYIGRQIGL